MLRVIKCICLCYVLSNVCIMGLFNWIKGVSCDKYQYIDANLAKQYFISVEFGTVLCC